MQKENDGIVYPPSEVARRLSVSSSGLRRLALIYGELYGDLPRDHSGTRMWPEEAVARLEAARAFVKAGRISSIKRALEAVDEGEAPPAGEIARGLPEGALEMLVEEVRALRQTNQELLEINRAMMRQLGAPRDGAQQKDLEAQVADLEQRNQALLGELERRRLEKQPTPRPWWRFWGR